MTTRGSPTNPTEEEDMTKNAPSQTAAALEVAKAIRMRAYKALRIANDLVDALAEEDVDWEDVSHGINNVRDELHDAELAATKFEKILDDPGADPTP
jgi:hypothetical protein